MGKKMIPDAKTMEIFWVEPERLVFAGPDHPSGLYQATRQDQAPRPEHVAMLRDLGWVKHKLVVLRKWVVDGGKEEFVIVDGRSIVTAALFVNKTGGGPGGEQVKVLCTVDTDDDEGYLATSVAANEGQKALDPVERAKIFKAILKFGSTSEAQLAKRHSMSVTTLRELLKVLELAPAVQKAVSTGKVKVSSTRDLVKLSHAEQVAKLATLPQEPTVAQVRDAVKTARGQKVTTKPPTSEVRKLYEAMKSGEEHSLLSVTALSYVLGEPLKPADRAEIDRLLAKGNGKEGAAA